MHPPAAGLPLRIQRFGKEALGDFRRVRLAERAEVQRAGMRPQRLEQQTLLGQVDVRRQLGDVRAAVHIVRVFLERALEQRVDRRDRFQPFQRRAQRIVAVRRQQPLQRLGLLQTGLAERIERLPRQIRAPDLQNRQRNAAAEQRAPDVPDVAPDAFVGQVDFFQRAFQPGAQASVFSSSSIRPS